MTIAIAPKNTGDTTTTPPADAAQIILTGDRTTGPLHLGHYVGSLKNRVVLQDCYRQYLLLADAQALTDHADDPGMVSRHVIDVALDYLAVGIDPAKTTICVQSCLPALSELTMLYLNYVSVARLERNPTVKEEIRLRGFDRGVHGTQTRDVPAGFLCYPAAQAADITAFKATLVPVGEDQAPMIEQTNEIVRRVNRVAGQEVLVEARALIPPVGRLPGVDGKGKMSKSQGNAIPLSASADDIRAAVRAMYTDPNHLRVSDPGQVEGNVVFTYLDAFDDDKAGLDALKTQYRAGGLGDAVIKQRLEDRLQAAMAPIRERRKKLIDDRGYLYRILRDGTEAANAVTAETLAEVKEALGMFSLRA
jgi:tryptophanyl-tRNA synthetase